MGFEQQFAQGSLISQKSEQLWEKKMSFFRTLSAATLVGVIGLTTPVMADTTLVYHSPFGESGLNEAARVWMDEVENRTDGRVKFTRIFGGSLGKLSGQPSGLNARSFDVGQVSAVYNPGLYARGTVSILPFLTDDDEAHYRAIYDLFGTSEFQSEFDALNQKFLFNGAWVKIQSVSYNPLRTIEDLREEKIRAHGGSADTLTALGINTYAIPFGELPAAAEKRVVTAATIGAPSSVVDFGFGDIFNYWNDNFTWYYFPMTMTINKDSWNEIPKADQMIIEELNLEMVDRTTEILRVQEERDALVLTEQLGVEAIAFEDMDELMAAGKQSWEVWKTQMADKGIDGNALLESYQELLAKYSN